MQRRTKSLLQEINEVIPPKNKGMVIESRGQHLISTVTNLIDMIYETYDKEIALDIHRRLLISIRRSVREIANSLLFEPNRAETLEKFSALVNPLLQRVQELSGIDRYKVVIDTTTTTQADVENNTIRGKIYLQPTRAVEFIALDFVVTNAGSELL